MKSKEGAGSGAMKYLRLASIDLGTNSTRLLVADCDGEKTETLERRMVITRLGAAVDETKRLSADGMERTVEALRSYGEVMEQLAPAGVRAAATSALRECENGAMFLDRVKDIIGVRPEILPGEEEARLSYAGALSDIDTEYVEDNGPVLVFDIGGGSTEIMVGHPDRLPHEAGIAVRSIDVGCVRMSERFLKTDPPSPLAVGKMEAHIIKQLKPAIDAVLPGEPAVGIGLAGTVTTISGIKQGLEQYDTEKIHHSRLLRVEVKEIYRRLASVPIEERKRVMGLEPGRADVIVGGTAVLLAIMDLTSLDEILVSEKDILDGLVLELYRSG